jgi:hypothetical protein
LAFGALEVPSSALVLVEGLVERSPVNSVPGRVVNARRYAGEDHDDHAVWTMDLLPRDRHVMP